MSKINHKHKLHWVHLFAVLFLGSYFLLSKINTVHALLQENIFYSFLQLYFFGITFGVILLYLLSHDRFFPVAREIEKEEEKQEKNFLKKYLHHGKVLATFIVAVIGGPIFASLTARILLNRFSYKYLIICAGNIVSTFLTLGLGKGFIHFFNL